MKILKFKILMLKFEHLCPKVVSVDAQGMRKSSSFEKLKYYHSMSKFKVEETKITRVDPATGEIIDTTHSKEVVKIEAEPFFLTFSKQLLALYNTNVLNVTTKVLYKMLEFAEFNTGKVYMTTDRIEEIMQTCNISRASYQRAVKELAEIGIIIKGRGSYTIAEDMFWKGDTKMREKIINARMKISFSAIFPED